MPRGPRARSPRSTRTPRRRCSPTATFSWRWCHDRGRPLRPRHHQLDRHRVHGGRAGGTDGHAARQRRRAARRRPGPEPILTAHDLGGVRPDDGEVVADRRTDAGNTERTRRRSSFRVATPSWSVAAPRRATAARSTATTASSTRQDGFWFSCRVDDQARSTVGNSARRRRCPGRRRERLLLRFLRQSAADLFTNTSVSVHPTSGVVGRRVKVSGHGASSPSNPSSSCGTSRSSLASRPTLTEPSSSRSRSHPGRRPGRNRRPGPEEFCRRFDEVRRDALTRRRA